MVPFILHRPTWNVHFNQSPIRTGDRRNSEPQSADLAADNRLRYHVAEPPSPEVDWPVITFQEMPAAHWSEQPGEEPGDHGGDALSHFYRDGVKDLVLDGWRILPPFESTLPAESLDADVVRMEVLR